MRTYHSNFKNRLAHDVCKENGQHNGLRELQPRRFCQNLLLGGDSSCPFRSGKILLGLKRLTKFAF